MLVSIVQLSDIHFRETKNSIETKLGGLVSAIASTETSCQEYIIVLSGDIANEGSAQEYTAARNFLGGLEHGLGEVHAGANIRFLAVPGNHDCQLPTSEEVLRAALVSAVRPTFHTSSPDKATLDLLLEKQQNYFDFCR
jgi:3',5'-cyclic AMP phosphodiesterase CpdA